MAPTVRAGAGVAVESLIDMVLGLVPDAAVVVDEHGNIVALNEKVGRLFDHPPDDLVGRPVEVLVPERYRHRHRAQRDDFLEAPRVRAMGAGLELYGRRRDGSEFPVDISLAPIATAERHLVVAAIRDITERMATEAVHAQLAAIVRSSLDAILAITVDGRITSWNPGAELTLGYPAGDVWDRHISLLIPEDASASFEEQLDRALRGEPAPPVDTEWLTRSGDRLPVAVSVSPMLDSAGALTGFSVLLRDITEAKRSERELRRLLAVSERQARWQEAAASIRLATLDGRPLEEIVQLITDQCLTLVPSTGALLVRAGTVAAASGPPAELVGTDVDLPGRPAGDAPVHRIARDDLDGPLAGMLSEPWVLLAPARREGTDGAVLVCDAPGDAAGEDAAWAEQMAAGLAEHVAMAAELERAHEDRERLLLTDERERIARDLHDHAVQALFATGLSLQSILPLVGNDRAAERVHEAVDSLDATIRQIRTAIFTLSAPPPSGPGLRADMVRLAGEAARGLGFEPAVSFDGPVDTAVPPRVAAHVSAVVREALANVARHARASSASVELAVQGDECRVRVVDDGVGITTTGVGRGLANLRARAQRLGGDLDVDSEPGRGTRLEWHVPLTEPT